VLLFSPDFGVGNTIALIVIVDTIILLWQLYNLVDQSMTELKNRADDEERLFNEMIKEWGISTIAMEEIACRGEQVLAVAEKLQKDARKVYAIWARMPYDKTLKKYFEDSITNDVEIIRYIDITQVSIEDILDHVLNFWDRETYTIAFVSNLQFEMLLSSLKSA